MLFWLSNSSLDKGTGLFIVKIAHMIIDIANELKIIVATGNCRAYKFRARVIF
jgi:hypothetical protein